MNKLRPILQGSPSKLERLLLSSSQLDMPPRHAKRRAFALLGMGSSVIATTQVTGVATATAATPVVGAATATAATGTGAVAAAGATTGFAFALLKGLAIGAVTGTIAYGSLTVHRLHKQTAPAPAEHGAVQTMTPERNRIERTSEPERASGDMPAVASARETGSLPATDSLPKLEDIAVPAAVVQTAATSTRPLPKLARAEVEGARPISSVTLDRGETKVSMQTAAVPSSALPEPQQPESPEERPSLKSERATIELAQAFVRNGDPAAALRTLSEHLRRYPKPQLGPEATLVRIEALLKLGLLTDAQRLGMQFLASQPDGPYAQRVRSLLNLPAAP